MENKLQSFQEDYINEKTKFWENNNKLPKVSMRVLEIIEQTMVNQNEKGLKKYGTTIDEAKHSDYDWNVMVIEELVDGIQYVVKENERLKEENELLKKGITIANSFELISSIGGIIRDSKDIESVKEFRKALYEYVDYKVEERVKMFSKIKQYNLSNLYPEKMGEKNS